MGFPSDLKMWPLLGMVSKLKRKKKRKKSYIHQFNLPPLPVRPIGVWLLGCNITCPYNHVTAAANQPYPAQDCYGQRVAEVVTGVYRHFIVAAK